MSCNADELKLVLVGHTSVGKTCVVRQATSGKFTEDCPPTLGASYLSKIVSYNNQDVRLQIWDTAGQERYKGMAPMYFRGAHVALVVYSVTDQVSFDALDTWIDSLKENAEPDTILFLVGNKIDMENERVISTEVGSEKARSIGAEFYEVSAKTSDGIEDLFNAIPTSYFSKHKGGVVTKDPAVNIQGGSSKGKSGGCCK